MNETGDEKSRNTVPLTVSQQKWYIFPVCFLQCSLIKLSPTINTNTAKLNLKQHSL
jgi:hypothetical protein